MSTVLIISNADDMMTGLVVDHLTRNGTDFARFNTEDFPQKAHLTIEFQTDTWEGELCLPNRRIDLKEICVVWNRRPHLPEIDPSITDSTLHKWSTDEAVGALSILWNVLHDKPWVNPIDAALHADNNKWLQLFEAQKVGFQTSWPCILSNDPMRIEKFCREADHVAMKRIRRGLLEYPDGKKGILYTIGLCHSKLSPNDYQRMRMVPVLLQRYIEKKFELRIMVVGDQVFGCAIHSQEHMGTKHDWRAQIFNQFPIRYEQFELPRHVAERCITITRHFNLTYSAIDIAVTPENEYVFFELNPTGEWGWTEFEAGLPISKAIADLLTAHI